MARRLPRTRETSPRWYLRPPAPARHRCCVRGRVALHDDLGPARVRDCAAASAPRDGGPHRRRVADRRRGAAVDAHARGVRRAQRRHQRHVRPDRSPDRPALAARPADRERSIPLAPRPGAPRLDARTGVGTRRRRRGRRPRRRRTRPGAAADDSVGLGSRPAPASDGTRRSGPSTGARRATASAARSPRSSTDPARAVSPSEGARPSPPTPALVAAQDRRRPRTAQRSISRVATRTTRHDPRSQTPPAYTPSTLLAAGRPSRAAPQTVHLQSGSRRSEGPGQRGPRPRGARARARWA